MLTGFCFAAPGSEFDILEAGEDDFCLYLREHCYLSGTNVVAMDLETKNKIPYGVRDLIHSGIKVVIVDPVYSPIHDKQVLPLNVHRDHTTLGNHYPGAVCVGRLLVQQVLDIRASQLRRIVICLNHGSETPVLNNLDFKALGWKVNSISNDGVLFAEL